MTEGKDTPPADTQASPSVSHISVACIPNFM